MSTEENKAVVRRFADAFTKQDGAALRDVLAPDLARVVIEQWLPNNNAIWADHRAQISDLVAEGDKVWALLATSGRHIGPWMGLPTTGKAWTNRVALFCRLDKGKIVQWVVIPDLSNHADQLGAAISVSPK